jgi:hypothetical protein
MDASLFKKMDKPFGQPRSRLSNPRHVKTFYFKLNSNPSYPSHSEIALIDTRHHSSQKTAIQRFKIKIIDDTKK